MNSFGIYVHVPFCRKRCLYCGFFTGSPLIDVRERYVAAVLSELRSRVNEISGTVDTLYIGGGTPSLLSDEEITDLLTGVDRIFGNRFNPAELTIEVNPEDVSPRKVSLWRSLGINRVSMGVQTFDDNLLSAVGRNHSADCARKALQIVGNEFENISIDLMFGLPGQSYESFFNSVDEVLKFSPTHISVYSLMYDERSALRVQLQRGVVEEQDEADYHRMYADMSRRLSEVGYDHYEISNFARSGYRSRHNSSYWSGLPYLGVGAGAHSYDGKRLRRGNINDLRAYVNYFMSENGIDDNRLSNPVWTTEHLSDYDLIVEAIMTGLRCKEGIDLQYYESKFGHGERSRLERGAAELLKKSPSGEGRLIEMCEESIALTLNGMMVSDDVMVDLLP